FANLSAVIGNVRAGSLRALAVTSARRSASAPEIPTVAEAGIPGFEAETWFGIVATAGTAREIVAQLNSDVRRVLSLPAIKRRFGTPWLGKVSPPLAALRSALGCAKSCWCSRS